jgi:hypothetical protein
MVLISQADDELEGFWSTLRKVVSPMATGKMVVGAAGGRALALLQKKGKKGKGEPGAGEKKPFPMGLVLAGGVVALVALFALRGKRKTHSNPRRRRRRRRR